MKPDSQRLTTTVDEAAQLLGVSRGTVYEAVRTKQISAIRVGRRLLIPRHALPGSVEAGPAFKPRVRSYEDGVADERARTTDLLIKLLAEIRSTS